MMSFLQQLRIADGSRRPDLTTDGESAHVYAGDQSTHVVPRDTTRIRVDRTARHLDGRVDYGRIFSLELPETVMAMDANLSTQGTSCLAPSKMVQAMQTKFASYKPQDVFRSDCMINLRNVAFPPDLTDGDLPTFDTSGTDLGRVLPARRNVDYLYRMMCNGFALRDRFVGLPVHRVCYYQSHESEEVAIKNLRHLLKRPSTTIEMLGRDCVGMTPLHILACSTRHRPEMYLLLIEKCPSQLVAEDKWGDVPLTYAIWGRAPWEVVNVLADSMKEQEYHLDLEKMVSTLCKGLAPIACTEYLIEIANSICPNHNMQGIYWANMVRILCTEAKAPEEHVRQFISVYSEAFPENNTHLESLSLSIAAEEKFGFRPFWLRIGIYSRLSSLGKEEWRGKVQSMIDACSTGSSLRSMHSRVNLMENILRQLDYYELAAQLWVLELALWKAKIGDSEDKSKRYRSHCQITCGADAIIPNVMRFLT